MLRKGCGTASICAREAVEGMRNYLKNAIKDINNYTEEN
jgi:hypothetical protein